MEVNSTTGRKESLVIHMVGDVGPRRIERRERPEGHFEACAPTLKQADIVFGHLERALSTKGKMNPKLMSQQYVSRVHPDNIRALTAGGFNIMSLAGNKIMGWGPDALFETMELLKKNGIAGIGAGRNLAEATKPEFIERKGTRVGFLAYCCAFTPGDEALENRPGINPIHIAASYEPGGGEFSPGDPPNIITVADPRDVERMQQDIRAAKSKSDVVIVSQHWGVNYLPNRVAMYQPVVGHAAIDAGADLVVGHHSHVPRGIEIYKGKAIFYSVGDFCQESSHSLGRIPEYGLDFTGMTAKSIAKMKEYGVEWLHAGEWDRFQGPIYRRYLLVAKCVIADKRIQKVGFVPMYMNPSIEPQPLTHSDSRFEEIMGYMRPLAKDYGTELEVVGDEVIAHAA